MASLIFNSSTSAYLFAQHSGFDKHTAVTQYGEVIHRAVRHVVFLPEREEVSVGCSAEAWFQERQGA